MEDVKVTIQDVVAVFNNTTEKKRLRQIKEAVVASLTPPDCLLNPDKDRIEARVEELVKQDKKLNMESELVYNNGYYRKRKKKPAPKDGEMLPTDYVGRAGECAVMSELLFHGYNVNHMMVDDGVDIVAVKNNIYYYIQVKTVNVKDGVVRAQIGNEKFAQYIDAQMRYFVVARFTDRDGIARNMFFQFTPQFIRQAQYNKAIKFGQNNVSIKIRFDDKTGEPILYDEKEMAFGFCKDNFDL